MTAGGFSAASREDHWSEIAEREHDLLVIGGGITGVGIARDAACRGLRVALVEAGDIASGTSSVSVGDVVMPAGGATTLTEYAPSQP